MQEDVTMSVFHSRSPRPKASVLALTTLAFTAACAAPASHLEQGKLFTQQGNHEQAVAEYQAAVDESPDSVDALVGLGGALTAIGRYPQATQALEKALALAPSDRILIALATTKFEQRLFEDAEKLVNNAVELAPNNPENHVRLGLIRFELGDLVQASAAFQKALALDPKNVDARAQLGRALVRSGKHEDALRELKGAVSDYRAANRRVPASVLVALGRAHEGTGDNDGATRAYRQALAADPKSVDALAAQGRMMRRSGQVEESIAQLTAATRRHDKAAILQLELGLSLNEFQLRDQAIVALQTATTIEPSLSEAYPPLLAALDEAKAEGDVIYKVLTRAALARPEDFEIQLRFGREASSRKSWEKALASLQHAVAITPGHAEANYLLGMAQIQSKQLEEARESYQALLVVDAQKAEILRQALEAAYASAEKADDKPQAGDRGTKKSGKKPGKKKR